VKVPEDWGSRTWIGFFVIAGIICAASIVSRTFNQWHMWGLIIDYGMFGFISIVKRFLGLFLELRYGKKRIGGKPCGEKTRP
jgi:hypothetical protein